MRKFAFRSLLLSIFFVMCSGSIRGQVGINTEDPQASLDINGNLRIATVTTDNTLSDVLVIGTDNIVCRKTASLLSSQLKSFVKGTGGSLIVLSVELLSGWKTIQFGAIDFDLNNDYSTSTYKFTAPVDGIYDVFVQFKTSSVLGAGELGVGIIKQEFATGTISLVAEETFTCLALLGINITPPTRKTQTLLQLKANDIITFVAHTPVVNVTLLGGTSSFFTISQVH